MSWLSDGPNEIVRGMLTRQFLSASPVAESLESSWSDASAAEGDEGKAAEIARTPDEHRAAAGYHAREAKKETAGGNPGRAAAHHRAASAHVHAAGADDPRASIAANLASNEAHRTSPRHGGRSAGASALTAEILRGAAEATLDVGLSDDASLPPDLRGKGLVIGTKPVPTFRLGLNVAKDGREFLVDQRAVAALVADGNAHAWIPFTYSHEEDPEHGAENSGYAMGISVRDGYLVADRVAWTGHAAAKLASGARGPVSPDVYTEHLDPATNEILERNDPRYLTTNRFRPVRWRAISLVGTQALADLPAASLGAARTTDPHTPGCGAKGETKMTPEWKKRLARIMRMKGPAKTEALAAIRAKGSLAATATDRETLAAAESFDAKTILDLVRNAFKFPPAIDDDTLAQLIDKAMDATGVPDEDEEPASDAVPNPLPAAASAAVPPVKADATPPEAMAAMASKAATEALAAALPGVSAQLAAEQETKRKAQAIDSELLAAETDGRLVAARREEFRERLANPKLADAARQDLSAAPRGPRVPSGQFVSGGMDPSISVDNLPTEEANEILSRASAWAMNQGLHPRDFPVALAAVRGGDPDEETYHKSVMASRPDWSASAKKDAKPFGGISASNGSKWTQRMNASSMRMHKDFDPDKLKSILNRFRAGGIPDNVIPADLQRATLSAYDRSQKLAGDNSFYQPAARFPIPGFAFGFFQGDYGGSEIAPEWQGGVNKQVYYPIYGKEGQRVIVNSVTGKVEPIGPRSDAKPSMRRGYDYKLVTLAGYGNVQWVDRDESSAADTVLPIGLMAMAAQDAMAYAKNEKEYIQAAALRDTSNYTSGFTKDSSAGDAWSDPATKIVDQHKAARVKIWRATGAFAEMITLMGVDVVEKISTHPQVLTAAQTAGVGHLDKPMAYAPPEMLVALFGPIVTPTCRISTAADGSNPDTPWGQDVILAAVSREIIAPRAFVTPVQAGYPITQAVAEPVGHGLRGRDGIDYSDVYAVEVAGPTGATTSSAFLWQSAVSPLAP